MRLWFDLDNFPDVNVFCPIIRALREHEIVVTTRRFSGLDGLLAARGLSAVAVGAHYGSSPLSKGVGTLDRTLCLLRTVPRFDASIGSLGAPAILVSRIRSSPSIGFLDGDLVTMNLRVSAPFVDHLFVPDVFDPGLLERLRLVERTVLFHGFKEDIALADYEPDRDFLTRLPFKDYVIVRPEAFKAEYVTGAGASLVPELLRLLEEAGVNVLYLPRYADDIAHAADRRNVHIPRQPLNGLDACHFARGVLTGSGSFAREAAVLGVPAASFFPNPKLLSVDRDMVRRGWVAHSRDSRVLVRHVLTTERRPFDRERCRGVFQEVLAKLTAILAVPEGRVQTPLPR